MSRVSSFGNDLYTGRRGVDFVGRRRLWFLVSGILVVLFAVVLGVKGLNLGLEFRGGSEFRVSGISDMSSYESKARDAVESAASKAGEKSGDVTVTKIGSDSMRVQTEKLDEGPTQQVSQTLGQTFHVDRDHVSSTFVGPSWGSSVSQQALRALIIFFLVVALVLSLYFRTWKMSAAALLALVHDMVITVGVYTLLGFEVTPATMIGFLTVLAYSLYDTVVVFDKVRENVRAAEHTGHQTFGQAANLAVNQTMVRSINTSMMSVLPVAVVLVVGLLFIGPGVLLDLSLILLVGILIGAYSSVFIATPVYVMLRSREPRVHDQDRRALKYQQNHGGANYSGVLRSALQRHDTHNTALDEGEESSREVSVGASKVTAGGAVASGGSRPVHPAAGAPGEAGRRRPLHPSAATGPRNQPRRTPRSKR